MSPVITFLPILFIFLIHISGFVYCHTEHPLFLLVSFDGFRWDYLEKAKQQGFRTPNFDQLTQEGVTLDRPGLMNSFATKTFPNHYTLVTGMFEERHGVVGNEMYDLSNGEHFSIRNRDDVSNSFWFNNGSHASSEEKYRGPQPIWNQNQMFGNGPSARRSGVMFWPGSEAAVGGDHPAHCEHYNDSLPNITRINKLVGWFATEDKPINLGLLYFSEPDHTGHISGTDNNHMWKLIEELDGLLGILIQKLKEVHLFDHMNIIITSDHGMVNKQDVIEMDNYIDPELYEHFGGSPVWNILPNEGKEEDVYEMLKTVPNVHVYKKEDIPRAYHYTYNRRIMSIVVEAAEHYGLCHNKTKNPAQCLSGGGIHGYNNSLPSMHPFFIAHGPAFKKNHVAQPFRNVDVYPLMCHVLDIKPPDNIDGRLENSRDVLFVDDLVLETTIITFMASVAFTTLIAGVCCIAACRVYRIHVRKLRVRKLPVPLNDVYVDSHRQLLNGEEDDDEDDTFT